MGEGSEGCIRLRSADLSQVRDLLYPPCHFLLDKRVDKLCTANGPTKVRPSFGGDAHIQVTKDALGFAQEGMLNHQPGLAAVGVISIGRANFILQIPPAAESVEQRTRFAAPGASSKRMRGARPMAYIAIAIGSPCAVPSVDRTISPDGVTRWAGVR